MAGASLLMLLDDMAALMDDIALMSKVAAKKTAGVLGDDLALNAQQVNGVAAERELPVVWAVAKGSALNKAILIPAALGLSAAAPWAITPLLMAGGAFLCYEGTEKILEKLGEMRGGKPHKGEEGEHLSTLTPEQFMERERRQIKGAIRTDFILSAEIVVISLGTMAAAPFLAQLGALTAVGAAMTVGVYGAVAGIVKMDDAGLALMKRENPLLRKTGGLLVRGMGPLMKGLTIAGTAAMFLVGGSILAHAIPAMAGLGGVAAVAADVGVGLAAGLAAVGGHKVFEMARSFLTRDGDVNRGQGVMGNAADTGVEQPSVGDRKKGHAVGREPVPGGEVGIGRVARRVQDDSPVHDGNVSGVEVEGETHSQGQEMAGGARRRGPRP